LLETNHHCHTRRRLQNFLVKRGLWNSEQEKLLLETSRAEVLSAMKIAETEAKPPLTELFTDVFDAEPAHLTRQRQNLTAHVKKYKEQYETALRAKRIKMDLKSL
jgi:2-oxoisovalerate dehydrogenase E1 component alpha subunit